MAWAASGRSTPRRTPAPVTTDSLASPRSPAVACGRWACSAEVATTPPSSPSTADLTESGCPDPTVARKADDQCACESACCSCRWSLAGLSWKVWLEAGTAKCDTGSGGGCASNTTCPLSRFYTTGNPPILFDDIEGPAGIWAAATPSTECLANDVPAGTAAAGRATFNADLATGPVANYNMIIPNVCADGESTCKPLNNRYTQFDTFLPHKIPNTHPSPPF